MTFHTWLTFLVAAILISISPGSGAVASMTSGLNHGVLRSFWTILGLQLGLIFQVLAVGFGVGVFAVRSEVVFQIIKWFGVCYLIWLGIQCWRSGENLDLAANGTERFSRRQQTLRAFLVNITNPKAYIFMVAILPQFVEPQGNLVAQFAIMAATLVGVDFIVMNGYASFASSMARFLNNQKHRLWLNRFFGVLFLIVAFVLAWARRVV